MNRYIYEGKTKEEVIDKALNELKITDEALNYIANLSSGDMRFALNLLEISL